MTKRPWWQLTKTARHGFILGGMYLVLAALALVCILVWPSAISIRILAPLWLILGGCYLTSAMAMRRRR